MAEEHTVGPPALDEEPERHDWTSWIRTDEAKGFSWTLPVAIRVPVPSRSALRKSCGVSGCVWMKNGHHHRLWLNTPEPKESGKWPRLAADVCGDARPSAAVVGWSSKSAVVSVDGAPPVALAPGKAFQGVAAASTEMAVGVDTQGRVLVAQAAWVPGRPGITLDRWTVAASREGDSPPVRHKTISPGGDHNMVPGSLAVSLVGPYMKWSTVTEAAEKPHWCVTWAAWSDIDTDTDTDGGVDGGSEPRTSTASVFAMFVQENGATTASSAWPLAQSTSIPATTASGWSAAVWPMSVPESDTHVAVTCLWCEDVVVAAWPSRRSAGFLDTTRITAAPWSRIPGALVPITGIAMPQETVDEETRTFSPASLSTPSSTAADMRFAFLVAPREDPGALSLLLFRGGWVSPEDRVSVARVGRVENPAQLEEHTRRLGLPWARVLGGRGRVNVALMSPFEKEDRTIFAWKVAGVDATWL